MASAAEVARRIAAEEPSGSGPSPEADDLAALYNTDPDEYATVSAAIDSRRSAARKTETVEAPFDPAAVARAARHR
jgi:hypothetical protein